MGKTAVADERRPFDPEEWDGLRTSVAKQLNVQPDELGRLHEIIHAPRKNRRRTTGRNCDVDALEQLVRAYEAFVCRIIAPHVASKYRGECEVLIFQSMPALRVCSPNLKASGQRHRDGAYGHQPGQVVCRGATLLAHKSALAAAL